MRIAAAVLVALLAGCFGSDSGQDSGPGPEEVAGPPGLGIALGKVIDSGPGLLHMVPLGDGSGRLLLVHQKGLIQMLDGGVLSDWANLSDRVNAASSEQGLLSIALAPDYATSGRVYADYTGAGGQTRVSRFSVDEAGRLDPDSEEVLLSVEQPFSNHNGGHILFGPDGMLYISLGDGGAAGDPMANGQNPGTLLGSILRIDVSGPGGYTVPADNPFVGDPRGADEVWAYGLRNVWRMSFDGGQTGAFWTADVGQNAWEEVNRVPAARGGANYGWSLFEGDHHFPAGGRAAEVPGMIYPVTEYDHGDGCSITGGYVYRGSAVPDLAGRYVFGDYCSGTIWAIDANATGPVDPNVLLMTELRISSFAVDAAGELYVLHHGGTLYRFEASSTG